MKLFNFEEYIHNFNEIDLNENILAAIITPDKDIIPNAEYRSPKWSKRMYIRTGFEKY